MVNEINILIYKIFNFFSASTLIIEYGAFLSKLINSVEG